MGSTASSEQLIVAAIEKQDAGELRTLLKDFTAEQIRELCKTYMAGDENQCTILHFATWQDDPELLAPLLDYADDLEIRDGLGWTPLMTAVNRGSRQNINLLLTRGAKVDCDWTGGMSLIADAMHFDDTELILLLIEHGARVVPTAEMLTNGQDQGSFYLLNYAVDDGLFDVAKVLIEKGHVPLNTLDQNGWTPLHLAAGHNNSQILTLLLEKGADVNIKDSQGNTPLAWAREMKANESMEILTKHGGMAETIWHGESLDMKTSEERAGEFWIADETETIDKDREARSKMEKGRFEIEIDDGKAKRQNSTTTSEVNPFDNIQRQRQGPKTVV